MFRYSNWLSPKHLQPIPPKQLRVLLAYRGGVPDSTLRWSDWLHVEDDGWPR